MAYTAGDPILDDEYNTFVNNSSSPFGYNHFAGTGSGEYGLGQTPIATVSAGDTINASHWNTLFTGLDTIANHTNDTMTSRSAVSAGDTIAIKAAVATDLATLAASVAGGSTSATAIDSGTAAGSSTNSGTWNSTSTIERSVTFASADAMRHYFNAGGIIRIDPSCITGIDGSKDTVFNDLTTTATGNLDLKAHSTSRSGSGETLTTNGLGNGFHDLGTGYTVLLKLTSDNSGYTSNTVEYSAKLNAAVGSATVLTIKMVSVDADNDDTYTGNNTSGVPSNPNEAPRMTLALLELFPTNAQGLASAIRVDSNAEVSNSAS
tara:strand:- start:1823 stop:2782 length:960 start_codon:yes stop_codon:yes gene_type:complete